MKKIIFVLALFLYILPISSYSQTDTILVDTSIVKESESAVDGLITVGDEVVKVITNDTTATISLPSPINPVDPASLFEWWIFLYGLLVPIGVYIFSRFFPASTKRDLIIKSTSIALIALLAIIFSKGVSITIIGQSFLAFVMQVITYDKIYKPLGMESKKTEDYT